MTIEYMDGHRRRYRIIPDTLRTPFPVEQIPTCQKEFESVLAKSSMESMKVKRLKFDCELPFYYRDTIEVTSHNSYSYRKKHSNQ
jgi:hypothetical protein